MPRNSDRVIIAYSGESPAFIPAVQRAIGPSEIVAVIVDLGQAGDLEQARSRALADGAVGAHVLDLSERFLREYVVPSLQADAAAPIGGIWSPLPAALSRPLIAQALVRIAQLEHASTVVHGASSSLPTLMAALAPDLRLEPLPRPGLGTDANLWGRTLVCRPATAPWTAPGEAQYQLTRSVAAKSDEPAVVELAFDRGVPTAINGVAMPLADLIASLTLIAGAHGIGRVEGDLFPPGGVALRVACEAPAAVLLHAAVRELRQASPVREAQRFERIRREYGAVLLAGRWFTAERGALDREAEGLLNLATGAVRVKLFKGHHHIHDNALVRTV